MSPASETDGGEAPAGWPLDARLAPPPSRPGVVERPRLLRRLADWSEIPVVALQAPAGYGKTTLLAQYAAADGRTLAWLTLEPGDDDPATLVRDLAAALDPTEPVGESLLDALRGGQPAVIPRALPRLARHVHRREQPFLLVLDGAEELISKGSRDVLRAVIDHLPPGSQLVLGIRGELIGLATPRLRAAGRFAALGAEDLRARDDELADILRGCGAPANQSVVREVRRRTEGWPVAVYLAGLGLLERPGASVEASLNRDDGGVADYFRDEVLDRTRRGDAEFLRRASVLDRLVPATCDAVLERDDSGQVLAHLARANLFVTAGSGTPEFRLHPLFAEALRDELRREDPGLHATLHRRAGAWFRAEDEPEDAIRHALAAGDVAQAADVVWLHLPAYESRGQTGTLARWLGMFASEDLERQPALALTAAWCRIDAGDGDEARDWATVLAAAPPDQALVDGSSVGAMIALLRSVVGLGEMADVIAQAERTRELGLANQSLLPLALYLEGSGRHLTADRDAARPLLLDAERLSGPLMPTVNALVLAQLALLAVEGDDWREAERLIERARARVRRHGLRDYATLATFYAVSALVAARRGDLATAGDHARHAAGLLALHQRLAPWLAAQTAIVLARTQIRLGDFASARALAADAEPELHAASDAVVLREYLDDTWTQVQAVELTLHPGPSALTTAERRVLQHLPTHLSFREIGEHLHVSQTTVKTQALAVYRKLDVRTRSDAVGRAQGLGLLEP